MKIQSNIVSFVLLFLLLYSCNSTNKGGKFNENEIPKEEFSNEVNLSNSSPGIDDNQFNNHIDSFTIWKNKYLISN